ncbi:MAG: ROK family protein [Pseudomonadota bacterium]
MTQVLGIDIGGSGIKAALVDTGSGELVGDRQRIPTPAESTPANMASAVNELLGEFNYDGPVGCCFPAAIVDGRSRTAANIDDAWLGERVDKTFSDATGLPFTVLNDADAAAVAEMRLGAGVDLQGLVITVTIGTGIGSGLFHDGRLVPNLEIGHMPGKDGESIENYASDRARKAEELSWDEWGTRLDYFLRKTTRVMTPDHYILGGGASKKFDRYEQQLTVQTPIHIARFLNNAGIIGAAMAVLDET